MSRCKLPGFNRFLDCSALLENGKCTRLEVHNCQGEKCPFKRTWEEEFDSMQRANERLSSLDAVVQSHIAEKYYSGSKPWKEE